MKYFVILLILIGSVTVLSQNADGLWVPQSPEKLLETSQTVFVGIVTSITSVEVEYQSSITQDGTVKETVGPETMILEEYTINIEEFLKNPQESNTMKLLQATVGGVPSGPAKISGFDIGDRVLFYVPEKGTHTDFETQYSPESFKIPKQCDAKSVLEQPQISGANDFKMMQDGITLNDNFTANKPIQFVYNKDMGTLEGKSFDVDISISKIIDKNNKQIVIQENIHTESKPCEWISTASWEFVPTAGKYSMFMHTTEGNETGGETLNRIFTVMANISESEFEKKLVSDVIPPPLKQFKSGIPVDEIQCRESLVLVTKHDGSPACVKGQTIPRLIERGWINYANSEKTFLDKTVNEWESLSFEQVSTLYEKHDEFLQKTNGKHFYNMLGEFLVKDKMEKLLVNKDIQNMNDDFVVFAGMQLDSLPPRISYYAGVNSTDGKTYLLSGGSSSNKAHANNAKEIIIYDTTIQISIEELVTKEPFVTILPEDGNNARVEPYSILLDYDEKNTVEFYNTLDIPIIIESNDFENPASTKKWKTSLIYPNQTIAVTFNSTGFHVWDAKYLPNNSEFWEIMGSGDVGLFTTQSNNLEYTEKLEIARNIIHNSEIPVVGLGIGSDRGLTISLAPGITDVLPDAKEYYMERVKQLIPFNIPIVIED